MKRSTLTFLQATFFVVPLIAVMSMYTYTATAASTDLATVPLETSSGEQVKPNIFFVLDDSGSMTWDFLPDWAGSDTRYRTTWDLVRNSGYNQIYYNPRTTYSAPIGYDGTRSVNMTAAETSNWTAVKYDAYNLQAGRANNTGTDFLFVPDTPPTLQNLRTQAAYYTFVPGEYCSEISLRNCQAQTAPSTDFPFPAGLRWCTTNALNVCQATRIDTAPQGGNSYRFPRYPGGPGATATLQVSGGNNRSGSISGVTVNGVQIMSGATGNDTNNNNLAAAIADRINACTLNPTGNCGTTGYWASANNSVVTITAPSSLGAARFTPVVTVATKTVTPTAFAGGGTLPGQNIQTSINPGNTYPKSIGRTDCLGATCTYDEEMTNFANWWSYYHTRMQMAKTAVGIGFQALTTDYRLGFMTLNNNTRADFLNIADVTLAANGQKDKWYKKLAASIPNQSTPLRGALSTAGNYYAGKMGGSIYGQTATDPMQQACQRNYTLLSTDGYWNETENPRGIQGAEIGNPDGDVTGQPKVVRPFYDGNNIGNTLADVAQYYHETDIRSAAFSNTTAANGTTDVANNATKTGPQRMITSTIGLGVSGYMQYQPDYATATSGDYYDVLKGTKASATNCLWQSAGTDCNWPAPQNNTQKNVDDLWHAAVNGRGTYYSAGDPIALRDGIINFLNNIDIQKGAGAAVTPSNPNVTDTDNLQFEASFVSGQWTGEVARYTINPQTGIPGGVPDWTQSGTANTTTPTVPQIPLLDRRPFAERKIFTNNGSAIVDFDWDVLPTTLQTYFRIDTLKKATMSQLCEAGTDCVPAAQQIDSTTAGTATGMAGLNLVNYLRGDRRNESNAGGKYYNKREHVLGDIVGSQAAYVKTSNYNFADKDYAAFKEANRTRQGMVYVGANDGMLHAFNADNGAESWAYIPSSLLPKLYKLADKRYNRSHQYFVNGSPQQGEAYFDGKWHTLLVGGLSAGGRGYYALDVTVPTAPKVLWEFAAEAGKGAPTVTDPDLGYTYGIPIISKLQDGTWVVLVTSGYNNVSPGNGGGYLWVLDAKTGKVISKIGTGVGSAAAAMPGCTAAPCPSGLSRISAWMDNINLNNVLSQVYGGDLYGNVWRFDLRKLTAAGGNTATLQLLTTLMDDVGNRQPITSWIELGFASNSHIAFVGTGSYLGLSDIGSRGTQSVYAIKDPLTGSDPVKPLYNNPRSVGTACSTTVKTSCFMKQLMSDKTDGTRTVAPSSTVVTDLGSMNGWFVDLPKSSSNGERVNTDSTLQLGILLFVSNIPNSGDACGSGGSAYLNYLDYKTGLPLSTDPNKVSGVLLAGGSGMGSAPAFTATKDGKLRATIKLSTGVTVTQELPPPPGGLKTRRVSWRELATE